jgi:hypothetical protein
MYRTSTCLNPSRRGFLSCLGFASAPMLTGLRRRACSQPWKLPAPLVIPARWMPRSAGTALLRFAGTQRSCSSRPAALLFSREPVAKPAIASLLSTPLTFSTRPYARGGRQ